MSSTPHKVIIIGAGVSGLSAAHYLKIAGIKALVLESTSRWGGRVHSQKKWGSIVEYGAHWIHGNQKNPLYDYCKAQNIQVLATPETVEGDFAYISGGTASSSVEYGKKLKWFKSIEEKIIKSKKVAGQSLAEISEKMLGEAKASPEQRSWYDFFVKLFIEENYGAKSQEISAEQFGAPAWFGGGDYILPGGYNQVPQALSEGIDIQLNSQVTSIEKTASGVFRLTCADRSTYMAEQVLVTVPLGVLKKKAIQFTPELPLAKREAIERVGFGKFCKILVQLTDAKVRELKTQPSWLKVFMEKPKRGFQFFNLPKYSASNLLVGVAVAEEASLIEELNDEQLRKYVLERAPFLKAKDILNIDKSQWGRDPAALGAYCFPKINSSEKDFDRIGESVGRLHFAGEACQSAIYGTVEAAFVSGKKAAETLRKNI